MRNEHTQDGIADGRRIRRCDHHAGRPGKVTVAGYATERERVEHPVRQLHGSKCDVVRILQHRHAATAVKGDVELARQAKQLAVIQDVVVDLPRDRASVDQLLRVDAGGGAAGHVADVVGAGTLAGQAQIGQAVQHLWRGTGRDFTNLQVGAGGDVDKPAAQIVGQLGHASQLRRGQNTARHTHPAHEAVLRRRDIKQAVVFGQKHIDAFGEPALRCQTPDLVRTVQRVSGTLALLLRRQLAAIGDRAVLRHALQVGRVGRGGGVDARRDRTTACLHAGHEALQVLLLLGTEIIGHAAN